MWFITVFSRCSLNEHGWPDYGDVRTWGYYEEKEVALQAVRENWTDMWEYCYEYAVVEKLGAGISPYCEEIHWFKFDVEARQYVEIEAPTGHNCFGNFAFG